MKLFLDTANIDDIKNAVDLGVIEGVTTNPSLIAREGNNLKETINNIIQIVNGQVFAEVISLQASEMVREALELSQINENIIVKLPCTWDGLKACKELSKQGIKIAITLVFSPNQALLAARAGAEYVAPFVGRLNDISQNGVETLVLDIRNIFDLHNINTKIIAASVRTPIDVLNLAKAGAHVATIPFKTLVSLINHPLTDAGLEKFMTDWGKLVTN